MPNKKIRVFVADDHEILIDSLGAFFQNDPEIQFVGRATNGGQLLERLGIMRPDVALVDIRMPNIDGIEATHLIKSLYPTVKVLILTGFGNRRFVQEALNRGADGLISKHMGGEEILNAIKRVYKGDFVILLGIAENNSWQMELQSTFQPLTKRQREILCKIMEGLSNNKIAKDLSLDTATVETHRANIMRKVGAKNVADLVRITHEHHLCD